MMASGTIYKLRVRQSTWNGVTTYRPYILLDGHWKRYDTSDFETHDAALAFIQSIADENKDFEVVA